MAVKMNIHFIEIIYIYFNMKGVNKPNAEWNKLCNKENNTNKGLKTQNSSIYTHTFKLTGRLVIRSMMVVTSGEGEKGIGQGEK